MVRSDKNVFQQSSPAGSSEEGGEIEKIIKEIEDLEKSMDTAPEASAENGAEQQDNSSATADEPSPFDSSVEAAIGKSESGDDEEMEGHSNVTSIHSAKRTQTLPDVNDGDDAAFSSSTAGSGNLGLKVQGCAQISLDFAKSGVSITLVCSDDGLTIKTNQGAEFRLPFKKAA